jgi:hypothetical protein
MKQFQFHPFKPRRNDVFYAFVLAAMFAVSVAGAVIGAVSLVHGQPSADVAKAHDQKLVLSDPAHEAALAANAGARK